jgi:hypothetical protein
MKRLACFAALEISCSGSSGAPPPRPPQPVQTVDAGVDAAPSLADDLPRLALKAKQLYTDWAAAFADPTIDCPTATGRINALADKYADVAAANKAVFAAGHERVKAFRAELEKHEAEMMPIAKSIMESPIMPRCASDASFARAIDRLQGDA